jgi:hypothetical protein
VQAADWQAFVSAAPSISRSLYRFATYSSVTPTSRLAVSLASAGGLRRVQDGNRLFHVSFSRFNWEALFQFFETLIDLHFGFTLIDNKYSLWLQFNFIIVGVTLQEMNGHPSPQSNGEQNPRMITCSLGGVILLCEWWNYGLN